MILGTVIGIFGLADIVYLYKNIRKFYQLNSLIKKLSESSYLNVSDVIKLFDNKPIGHVIPNVIVKGVLKAKKTNADKNILSVIVSTPIS
jgi:hypothetical protein